jgi:Alpha/beta hydrolase domain
MTRRSVFFSPSVVAVFVALSTAAFPRSAAADGGLGYPLATPVGVFGGIAYVQYDGTFAGQTSTGAYRVPYRISAPANLSLANRTVVVEPPHGTIALGALNVYLRRDFLFSRGFVHAGIGWSTVGTRILDPSVPGTFIEGGFRQFGGNTDDEIIVDFARALLVDPNAAVMVGPVLRRYLTGFSDSSDPVLRLVTSGRAAGVFDFALPFIAEKHEPQPALAAALYGGKLIIVDSEYDSPAGLIDLGTVSNQYRFFVVAGTPHIPDPLDVLSASNRTTPATYEPALRAHFLQGDRWVQHGPPPPPSTQLRTSKGNKLDRDANGNAISVDASGPVPRLPILELGEARFTSGFRGSYDGAQTIQDLGFANHHEYLKAFADTVADYVKAGYMISEDAIAMRNRAALCPPLTFTETYRDHYEAFAAIVPCGD